MIVAAIMASGAVNASLLVGPDRILALGASRYGVLLLVKLGLFALMLALAATNRFRLTPALVAAAPGGGPDAERALRVLRRSIAAETAAAIAIFALVAALGTLEPPSAG